VCENVLNKFTLLNYIEMTDNFFSNTDTVVVNFK